MRRLIKMATPTALLTGVAFLVMTAVVVGQGGGDYDLSWWTVDGGGDQSSGGDYGLTGTAGQLDAATLTGGDYTLVGGFWSGVPIDYEIFLPLVLRNDT